MPASDTAHRIAAIRELVASRIRDVPDFPKPGILFKDVTPVFGDALALQAAIDALADQCRAHRPDAIVGIEARGFLLGAPIAYLLGLPFVPVRKPGKLPHKIIRQEYALEYGTNTVEMHMDAVGIGQRVVIVDDLLATGGTAQAAATLVEQLGATVAGFVFLVELGFLHGRDALPSRDVFALVGY